MTADVRITVDHHQLGVLIHTIETALQDEVRGEALAMVWTIAERLLVRLKQRHAARRIDYRLILTPYQAVALRRIIMAGQEFMAHMPKHVHELHLVLANLDPKVASLIHLPMGQNVSGAAPIKLD